LTDGGAVINIPDEKSDEKSPFLLTRNGRFLLGRYSIERAGFCGKSDSISLS